MLSKRSLLRHALTVAGGGLVAGGTAGATSGTRSSSTQLQRGSEYDASAVADTETTVTASIDRPVLNVIGVPDSVGTALNDLRQRYSSVALEDIQRVTGSTAIDGDTVTGGCAIAVGSFDTQAIRTEAREHGLEDGTTATRETETVHRLAADDSPYAIGVDDSALYVGYDRGQNDARAHVDAALGRGTDGQSRTAGASTGASANYGSLPSLLSGHAVAYASLGSNTRSYLSTQLTDAPDAFRSAIQAASAAGIALQAGSDRSRLRYGIVADPNRLSRETIDEVVTEATSGSLESDAVYRDGWTIAFDATVETDALWATHEQFLGLGSADDGEEPTETTRSL